MNKLVICGSRDFNNYLYLKKRIDKVIKNWNKDETLIIEGGARGADRLGRLYAEKNGIQYKTYPADWDKLGKRAGYVRNIQMAETATHAVVFWDGKSPGTKQMIKILEEKSVRTIVFKVPLEEQEHDDGSEEKDHNATEG